MQELGSKAKTQGTHWTGFQFIKGSTQRDDQPLVLIAKHNIKSPINMVIWWFGGWHNHLTHGSGFKSVAGVFRPVFLIVLIC